MIRNAYISLPKKFEETKSVTIEAESRQEGYFLLHRICDADLRVALDGLVTANIRRACWKNKTSVNELGLHTATVLQDDKDITLKIWVVPTEVDSALDGGGAE